MVSLGSDNRRRAILADVRHSEFWQLMDEEFGVGYARTVARDQVIAGLGGRTVDEALAAHVPPRQVWFALCDVMDVPVERRWGRNLRKRATP
jgi:hypothetical protein